MCDEELFLLIFIIEKASDIFSNRGIVVRQPSILTIFAQVVLLFFITISTVVVNNKYYCFYKIKNNQELSQYFSCAPHQGQRNVTNLS